MELIIFFLGGIGFLIVCTGFICFKGWDECIANTLNKWMNKQNKKPYFWFALFCLSMFIMITLMTFTEFGVFTKEVAKKIDKKIDFAINEIDRRDYQIQRRLSFIEARIDKLKLKKWWQIWK